MFLALVLGCGLAQAQANSKAAYDPNSPEAVEAQAKANAKFDAWTAEAEALTSAALFKEVERLDAAHAAKLALDPGKYMWGSDDSFKSTAFATVLSKRAEHDPEASLFDGSHQWTGCVKLQRQSGDVWDRYTQECWQKTLSAFKKASEAGIGDASFNIARQYQNGYGVTASKLVASEWYVKAAEQYSKRKDRDEALTSVERALDLVPDHPAALRLRKAMLK